MKSTFVRLAAAAMLGIAGIAAVAHPVLAEDIKVTVLGVGDIYAFDGGKVRGGFTRLNALAKAERAANPNTIYVHDGDMILAIAAVWSRLRRQHDRTHQSSCRSTSPCRATTSSTSVPKCSCSA
jgi:2',3'-cyclic-nucleotide 2'-phosphodiesterase (5'-nucleotidase family)